MKRGWIFIVVLLIALAGCVPAAPAAQPTQPAATAPAIKVTDALGREVAFSTPPQRIVITGKALIMVVDAVYIFPDASQRIAALGNAGQGTANFIALLDASYAAKATLQQDAGVEAIAAVKPDLVILKSSLAETTGKALDAVKIPVVYVDFETPDQYARDMAVLGKVFQNSELAQKVITYFNEKANAIQTIARTITKKPKVLLLYYSDKDGAVAFNVPPMAWMQTQIVQMGGGEPVWGSANPANAWAKVTLEQIAAWDADQIYIIAYNKNSSEVVANLKADPKWQALRAVQNKQLYGFAGDLYSWDQPDTRWILGLTWLAKKMNPEKFTQWDVIKETQQFYQTLYGLDAAFFESKIKPTFKGDLP